MEGGERREEGKRFVLVSTIPDVEMMKGTKAKRDGAASPNPSWMEPLRCCQRGLGVPGGLTETWGAHHHPSQASQESAAP